MDVLSDRGSIPLVSTTKKVLIVLDQDFFSFFQGFDHRSGCELRPPVERGAERYILPSKEFYLLFLLLSYPGRIFTRSYLMDEIWGPESDTVHTTINVHVNRLRARFGGWPEFEIVAVRGLDYKAVIHPEAAALPTPQPG